MVTPRLSPVGYRGLNPLTGTHLLVAVVQVWLTDGSVQPRGRGHGTCFRARSAPPLYLQAQRS